MEYLNDTIDTDEINFRMVQGPENLCIGRLEFVTGRLVHHNTTEKMCLSMVKSDIPEFTSKVGSRPTRV